MKKIYFILLLAFAPFIMKAQCGVQVQHTNELCFGNCNATAQAFPTGQSPYTYLWTPGNMTTQSVTGLCIGNYTVIVIDANNCTSTASFTVTQPTQMVSTSQVNPASCFGSCDGSAWAIVTGGTPTYTYLWSPGNMTQTNVNGLCAGGYTCTMTDANGCTSTQTMTVSQPTALTLVVNAQAASCSSCCDGIGFATASGGTAPYTYQWTPTGGNSSVANNLCIGNYTCCVTDANGCLTCQNITITFTTGIKDESSLGNLTVFPSPAIDFVNVKETFANQVSAVISISNLLGETVYIKSFSTNSELNENINVADLENGVYFISVKTSAGTSVRRFVKE